MVGTASKPATFSLWSTTSALTPANYKGLWDPTTDTPTLPGAGSGNNGWWYVASATGESASPIAENFTAGDIVWSTGSVWAQDTSDCGNGLTDTTNAATNSPGLFYGYGQTQYSNNSLPDTIFRTILQLQAITNTGDGTLLGIMNSLAEIFPGQILLVDNQNMTLTYYVSSALSLSASALASFLPKPMGVGITVIILTPGPDGKITIP